MKLLFVVRERAPTFKELAWRGDCVVRIPTTMPRRVAPQYRKRPEPESFFSDLHCEGRRMRAAIIFAVLVGIIVTAVGMSEMYDKCGQPCWQGLLQAQREP